MTDTRPSPPSRLGWPVRRVHKWMSIAVGGFLLLWVVSGLVMITPGAEELGPPPSLDYGAMQIAPAAAVQAIAGNDTGSVAGIRLQRLRDRLVYVVALRGKPPGLVDAGTGAVVVITPELAADLARDRLPAGTAVLRVERIERGGFGYNGPLPAYRVDLADGRGTRAYVSAETGEVQRNARYNRVRGMFAALHVFAPLQLVPGGERSRKLALWGTGVVAIAVGLTGYWMALPRRKRGGP